MVEAAARDGAGSETPARMGRSAREWLPLLAVAIAVALAYWPLLAGQVILHRDTALWAFPARWFVRQALLTGQSPAWNPYQGLGFSLLADPQYAPFYPPHWLLLLVPDGLVAQLASWLSLTHLIWGGLGMALLTRRLGACSIGVAVAGLSWALSGHTTSAWSVGPLLLGHAWIPWVARGFLSLARKQGRHPVASAVWPMTMSLLVGEVFVSAMALLFAAVVVLAGAQDVRFTRSSVATIAKAGAAWLLAVGIAAVTWLPPLLMVHTTERARPFDRGDAELYSHHPLRLLEMVAPGALGDPTGAYPAGQWVGEPGAGGAPLFFGSYLGVASVALALLALRRKRLPVVLAAASVLALLVAFGRYTPVHQIWRSLLFPFAHMHSPEKYVVLVVASLAPLAGLGASRLLTAGNRFGLRRVALLGGVVAGLALAADAVLPAPLVSTARAAGLRGLLVLAALFVIVWSRGKSARFAGLGVLALVALDLGLPAQRLAGFGAPQLLTRVPPAAATILEDNAGQPAPPRVFRDANLEDAAVPLGPTATWQDGQERALALLTPNTLNVFGLAVVPGYASAIPILLRQIGPATTADLGRMLRLLSVRYAFTTDVLTEELRATTAVTVLSRPLASTSLLRVDRALPRVYLPGRILRLPPAEAVLHLLDESVVSGREVLLLASGEPSLTAASGVGEPRECTIERFENTRITALCSAPSPSLAVFVEQFDSGWRAEVDGKSTPIERANLLVRAVALPAGSHRIELRYHTPGLRVAFLLSLMGLLGLAAIEDVSRRRASNRGP
jgi:hypothetical protein